MKKNFRLHSYSHQCVQLWLQLLLTYLYPETHWQANLEFSKKKFSKGRWINKGLWAFTQVVRREGCVYFSWLLRQLTAALREQVEPAQSHGGSSAFYSTCVPALGLFVFVWLMRFIPLSLSVKGFCSWIRRALNYRTFWRSVVKYRFSWLFLLHHLNHYSIMLTKLHPKFSPN